MHGLLFSVVVIKHPSATRIFPKSGQEKVNGYGDPFFRASSESGDDEVFSKKTRIIESADEIIADTTLHLIRSKKKATREHKNEEAKHVTVGQEKSQETPEAPLPPGAITTADLEKEMAAACGLTDVPPPNMMGSVFILGSSNKPVC